MKEKVLIFSSREICYMSSNFFANQLGAAFEELGYEADICEIAKGDDLDEKLECYIGKEYKVIVDFNSWLPRMVMEDDKPYLDHLKGPFFDYILDHPLFHYNGLTCKVENLNALVLDEAQCAYMKEYYPEVKHVFTLPLGATEAVTGKRQNLTDEKRTQEVSVPLQGESDLCKKECRIFFPGTYDRPEAVYELVEAAPEPLQSVMKALIERRIAEPLLPMEEAFREYLREHDMEVTKAQFALYMNAMYPVDAYVRDYFRRAAVDELLKNRIPVTVMGEGWEKYSFSDESCLKREKPMVFGLSFEKIAREGVLLNVSPIFNRGMHDRIPAGMANGAVVLTDENPYLRKRFRADEELCFYSLENLHTLSEQAGRLIEQPDLREKIARQAYRTFQEQHTWKCRAKKILDLLAIF